MPSVLTKEIFSDATAQRIADALEILAQGASSETVFKLMYDLCNKTTAIAKVNGNTQITETNTDDTVTAVTTVVKTSDTVTTITTVITPTYSDYIYTKSTVITKSSNGTSIVDSYTKTEKNQGGNS